MHINKQYLFIGVLWIFCIALVINTLINASSFQSKKVMHEKREKTTVVVSPTVVSEKARITSPVQDMCLGQSYHLQWRVMGNIQNASLNIVHTATPSSNFAIATDLVYQSSSSAGVAGDYSWKVGTLLQGAKLVPDGGYAFVLSVMKDTGLTFAISDPFIIKNASDCLPSITQEPNSTPSAAVSPILTPSGAAPSVKP